MIPRKIVVLGCSGVGKSTLARRLSRQLNLNYVPTDHVFWKEDWSQVTAEDVRAWAERATAADAWVLDGNFDDDRDIVWGRADLAIWLDMPILLVVYRVARRNITWVITRQKIWGGKRMPLRRALSGIWHVMRSHGVKRRTYPALLAELPNLLKIHIRSPSQLAQRMCELTTNGRIN